MVLPCSILLSSFHPVLLRLWGMKGPLQTQPKASLSSNVKKVWFFPPFVVDLLHTPSVSMSLFPVTGFQQCFISVTQPTQQNTTKGRHELLHLFIAPSFICHFLIDTISINLANFGDLTRKPTSMTSSHGSCSQGRRSWGCGGW